LEEVFDDAIWRLHLFLSGFVWSGALKLGLLTAAFPSLSLVEVAGWAAENGFDALEIACWPAAGAERRRYAGVCHVDVDVLDDSAVRGVLELVESRGLTISSLAYYPK
jgi:sugar phosphate isomerase/epimerase